MTTLPLQIDEGTAIAFRKGPPSTRQRRTQFVTDYLRVALQSDEERTEAYRRAADALSASAQANGWNEELNDALLRGDVDDE